MRTFFAAVLFVLAGVVTATPVQDLAASLGPGWNLGNTLEGVPHEGDWGNPPVTPDVFDKIRRAGLKSVRLPVSFGGDHGGPAPGYVIDPAWLTRIETVVDQALARDLAVILDFHNWWQVDVRFRDDPAPTLAKFDAVWTQLARRFRDKSPRLLFESINEPGDNPGGPHDITPAQVNDLNRRFVSLVRATGGANATRALVLPGRFSDGQAAIDTLQIPDDPNLIVTFHYYSPWAFVSGAQRGWGSPTERNDLHQLFAGLKARWVDRGVPVLLGEFGTEPNLHPYYTVLWHEAVVREARENGFPALFWDNGTWFNRSAGRWNFPAVGSALLAASRGETSSFVRSDDLYLPLGQSAAAQTLELDLGPNTLAAVVSAGRTWKPGTDYVLDGSRLVLKGSALDQVLLEAPWSEGPRVSFRFSAGAEAQVRLVSYEIPEIRSAELSFNSLENHHSDRTVRADFHGLPVTRMVLQAYQNGKKFSVPQYPSNREFRYDDNAKTLTVSGSWVLDKTLDDTLVTFEFPIPGLTCQLWLRALEEE